MATLLKVNEVAQQLGLSPKTVWAMIYRREIEVVRIGRSVRIPQSFVDDLISRQTIPVRNPSPLICNVDTRLTQRAPGRTRL
jgi:excisionase family DNA binding protein